MEQMSILSFFVKTLLFSEWRLFQRTCLIFSLRSHLGQVLLFTCIKNRKFNRHIFSEICLQTPSRVFSFNETIYKTKVYSFQKSEALFSWMR